MSHKGSCHCGQVRFEVEGDFEAAMECNCSICSRKGYLLWFVPRGAVKLSTPLKALSTYTFNKHVIQHQFCPKCGCAPFGFATNQGQEMAAVNIRCLEDVDLGTVKRDQYDGRSIQVTPARASTGYSGTPLAKKLGIVAGTRVHVIDAPANYAALLAPLPAEIAFAERVSQQVDVAHLFVVKRSVMAKQLAALRKKLQPDAALWISWPKKAAKQPTDITEDVIREVALPLGFVDIKVCAVDATWSGLKLVVRKELR